MSSEEWGVLVIWATRILGALPVLRWPFFGGLFAIGVDLFDLVLLNALPLPRPFPYQEFDKAADFVYMLTFLMVALRWKGLERNVALGLFAGRMIGFGWFELAGHRAALFLFPNVFEFWFLLVAARGRFAVPGRLGARSALVWLAALTPAKLLQEYVLHIDRRLDLYSLPEAIEWLKGLMR